jgi:hypothetical protein
VDSALRAGSRELHLQQRRAVVAATDPVMGTGWAASLATVTDGPGGGDDCAALLEVKLARTSAKSRVHNGSRSGMSTSIRKRRKRHSGDC